METTNDVIIQNLVVPSTILSNGNSNGESINLSLQTPEIPAPRAVTTGVISETRHSEVVNPAPCINPCQNLTKSTTGSLNFEEASHESEMSNVTEEIIKRFAPLQTDNQIFQLTFYFMRMSQASCRAPISL